MNSYACTAVIDQLAKKQIDEVVERVGLGGGDKAADKAANEANAVPEEGGGN